MAYLHQTYEQELQRVLQTGRAARRALLPASAALCVLAAIACGPAPEPASPPPPASSPVASAAAKAPGATPTQAAEGDPFAFDAAAPLDVKTESAAREGAALVQPISYASPKGGRVPALLVQPAAAQGRGPAILFQHWGEGDKTEFLDEAKTLAAEGFVSLLVDAPWWLRPEQGKFQMTKSYAYYTQAGVDLVRGVEVLAGLPAVDPARIGYVGHSFGAHLGAVVAAKSPRVRAFVLMAGTPSLSRMILESEHPFWKKTRAEDLAGVQALAAQMAPLDAERYIGEARAPVFHQFADHDEHITYAMAEQYLARTPDPKLWRYYEGDHALGQTARDDRRAFLRRLLAGGASDEARAQEAFFLGPQLIPFAYPLPEARAFQVQADRVYRKEGDRERKLDVYAPTAAAPARGRPAVIVVHGQGHPLMMRDVKRWASFQGLGQVLAARGYTAVVPDLGVSATGPEPGRMFGEVGQVADNVAAALRYVQQNARARRGSAQGGAVDRVGGRRLRGAPRARRSAQGRAVRGGALPAARR